MITDRRGADARMPSRSSLELTGIVRGKAAGEVSVSDAATTDFRDGILSAATGPAGNFVSFAARRPEADELRPAESDDGLLNS